jgi:hypothetical protein
VAGGASGKAGAGGKNQGLSAPSAVGERFRSYSAPLAAINSYLYYVYLEAGRRGYNFARHKVSIRRVLTAVIPVTEGQINFEYRHLGKKLMKRDREKLAMLRKSRQGIIRVNPLFYVIPGRIEEWERSAV